MSTPRVSVIVPFFKADRFLSEAVASVRAQSFSDWELILLDDGSRDASTQTARRFAEEDGPRIRCLTHPDGNNHGISASLNLGISEAKGELIALLDSDDVWLPRKLEEQVSILDAHPRAAMVYGPSQFWYSWTGKIEDRGRDRVEPLGMQPDQLVEPPALLSGILKQRVPVPCPCSVLLRKQAVDQVRGFEETFRRIHTDQAFYAKLFLSFPVFASGRCWARYRQHPESAVARVKRDGSRDGARQDYLEWLSRYLKQSGIDSAEVWDPLRKQLSQLAYRRSSRMARVVRDPRQAFKSALKRVLPARTLESIRRRRGGSRYVPSVGRARLADLRRLHPISRRWGYDRGLPIDRYYIEAFLERYSADIRGRVMEVGDDEYTWRFGQDRVTASDVLNVAAGDPKTTIVGDLSSPDWLPSSRFDCIIFTETLQLLYDFRSALRNLHRVLNTGGVLLATFPGITKIGQERDWGSSWYWSFTPLSARRLFAETFPGAAVTLDVWGNVLSATSFLWGLSSNELRKDELEHRDPEYPVTIAVRAVKTE